MKKELRLKNSDAIGKIVKNKQKVYSNSFVIYYEKGEDFKIAISASKKYGNSVERNHAKRIIRELVRPIYKNFIPMHIVIVVRQNLRNEKFDDLCQQMYKCFKIIERKIQVSKEEK